MSKHWTPAKPTVALKTSRIRRDPVRLGNATPAAPRTAVRSREQEMWGGVIGIVLMAAALVLLIVGVSLATIFHDNPAADARALQYDQCYTGSQNCVADAGTISVAGEKAVIAGIDAPRIRDAQCPAERDRGIDAAVRLANRLNSGAVTLGAPFRDPYGRLVRSVAVKGQDVGQWMIAAGIAREYLGQHSSWCSAGN